jgi:FkbM family methyltransferase
MYYDRFRGNYFSQNGEDGVLQKLITELGLTPSNMWCVDVGAYDGTSYSNVYRFIEQNANAVMIEPSIVGGACESKFEKLKELPDRFPKVIPLNYAVIPNSFSKEQRDGTISSIENNDANCGKKRETPLIGKSLDEVLSETSIPDDYDILNIDTDRCDHEIWSEHTGNPKIVIIEIDSSINPESNEKGSDLSSFSYSLELARKKGYSLICHTGNMIYVRDDLIENLSISPELINTVSLFNRGWL